MNIPDDALDDILKIMGLGNFISDLVEIDRIGGTFSTATSSAPFEFDSYRNDPAEWAVKQSEGDEPRHINFRVFAAATCPWCHKLYEIGREHDCPSRPNGKIIDVEFTDVEDKPDVIDLPALPSGE